MASIRWTAARSTGPRPRPAPTRSSPTPPPTVHPGRDPGDSLRTAQGRAPRTTDLGEQGGAQTRLIAVGSRLLQRGDHPLPAAGPTAVLDAGGRPRPQGRPSQGTPWIEPVQAHEEKRLVHPHTPGRQEKESHRVDLRETHPVDGSAW